MSFKKGIIVAAVGLMCAGNAASVSAQDIFAYLMDGPYVGAQVGYDSYSHQRNVNYFDTTTGAVTLLDQGSLSANGWLGGVLAGYGMYFKEVYYLGAEAYGNLNMRTIASATHTNVPPPNDEFTHTEIITRGNFGIGLLPGIKINESTLAYLRLGYNWANIQYKYTVQNSDLYRPDTFKGNLVGGFNLGVGLEAGLMNGFSMRADVNHTFYQGFYSSMAFYSTTYYQANVEPSDNQATVALIYHFG